MQPGQLAAPAKPLRFPTGESASNDRSPPQLERLTILATCYNYKGHTLYTDGRLYKAGELVGTYKTEAAAKAQATRRSRASNNARAAEHHASILAIWERKQ